MQCRLWIANKLKQYLPQTGVVIAAQKILIIPTFSGISNPNQIIPEKSDIEINGSDWQVRLAPFSFSVYRIKL